MLGTALLSDFLILWQQGVCNGSVFVRGLSVLQILNPSSRLGILKSMIVQLLMLVR